MSFGQRGSPEKKTIWIFGTILNFGKNSGSRQYYLPNFSIKTVVERGKRFLNPNFENEAHSPVPLGNGVFKKDFLN